MSIDVSPQNSIASVLEPERFSTPSSMNEIASGKVLECILVAMFDLHFYVDSKLRLLSDTVKLRHFLSIPAGTRATGRPVEVYVPLENDKSRLKWLIARAEEFQSPGDTFLAPPVARISMLMEGSPADVDVRILPEFPESSSAPTPLQSRRFLFCVNLADRIGMPNIPTMTTTSVRQVWTISPDPGNSHSSKSVISKLGRLNELFVSENPEMSDVSDIQRTTRAPRHLLLTQSLTRDLHESVRVISCVQGNSAWINPLMVIHDRFALQDELVRTLPVEAQRHFVEAINQAESKRASTILGRSFEGNLDIYNHQTLGATVRSSQLISATFRLFLAVATTTDNPSAALETLHGLAQWAYRIHTKYTITKGVLINTHLSLALATVALKFPSRFACEATKAWVTGTFASCFSCHQAFKSERDETSPLLYWVCLMWAGILRSFGESPNSITVLVNLREDIGEYLGRYPQCHSVNQLRLLCLNNLSLRQKDEWAKANTHHTY